MKPFNSDLVLEEKISEANLRAYNVGFDQNQFRLQPLVDVIRSVIPEFALGYYQGQSIPLTEIVDKLQEAARTVYTTEQYQKRGEFGELVLHLLLRDFCQSIPLVSKIYFKDSHNVTVHGFDGVHITIQDQNNLLWLGESKFYKTGLDGIKDLTKDLENHLANDYLRKEFELIQRKIPVDIPERDHWLNLMHKHQKLETIYNGICIPMVCTYSSDLFKNHTEATTQYLEDFQKECRELKDKFDEKKTVTNVDVILMLLPVPNKDELNTELDKRLKRMQTI